MGLMKANPVFFLLHLLHILLLDAAAWLTLWLCGTSFLPLLLCAVLLSTVQVRALGLSRTQPAQLPQGKFFVPLRRPRSPVTRAELRTCGRVGAERAHVPLCVAFICSSSQRVHLHFSHCLSSRFSQGSLLPVAFLLSNFMFRFCHSPAVPGTKILVSQLGP